MAEVMPSSIVDRFTSGNHIDKYKVLQKLGEGTFGAVYKVEQTDRKVYALKIESNKVKVPDAKKTGPDKHLSLGPAIGVSIQCLEAIEELHGTGYLHRDIKPGNFVVGRAEDGELRKLYIIDFGMCRKYSNSNKTIIKPRKKVQFRGTPRYAPMASHLKKEHCRRDDIESWFYILADLTNAQLPWKGVNDIKEIGEIKTNARHEPVLSELVKLGPRKEYEKVLKYIDGLKFNSEPNYGLIYKTLRKAMKKKKLKEFPYDWENANA